MEVTAVSIEKTPRKTKELQTKILAPPIHKSASDAELSARSRGLNEERESIRRLDEDQAGVGLLARSDLPAAMAQKPQEPIDKSRVLDGTTRRESRKLKIDSIEMPVAVAAGGTVTALVHISFIPQIEQAMTLKVRATMMHNLDPLGPSIQQTIAVPPGRGFRVQIPIAIPRRTSGDSYLEVEISDVSGELSGKSRIGFTIQ
jgi:hypothetical protein